MSRFVLWLVPSVEKFPRRQKSLLGDRLQATALDAGRSSAGAGEAELTDCRLRARRMQDTGYDTRRRWPDGVLARLSQTSVYDTWGHQ